VLTCADVPDDHTISEYLRSRLGWKDWTGLQAEVAGDDFFLDFGAAEALPERLATGTLAARLASIDSARRVLAEPVHFAVLDG
jgi:hypothetical protein